MQIGVFGFGQPLGIFSALQISVRDVTSVAADYPSAADPFIEPFMDPFAASLLRALTTGRLNDLDLLVFLRESPGALPAYHYACEFKRRGDLTPGVPELFLLNVIPAREPAVKVYNLSEIGRLKGVLSALGETRSHAPSTCGEALQALLEAQSAGRISGASAFEARLQPLSGTSLFEEALCSHNEVQDRPRLALLGAPLGNCVLHKRLEDMGALVVDQQALDQAYAGQGEDLEAALDAQALNPFAARQPLDTYCGAMAEILVQNRVECVFWQVDHHDDLWGWLATELRAMCKARGIAFVDLGFLPRWPSAGDLPRLQLGELAS